MVEDFANVKKQLEELGPLVSAFKSEAAQERLVEILFGATEKHQRYDRRRLTELWDKTDYQELVLAAADDDGRLRSQGL